MHSEDVDLLEYISMNDIVCLRRGESAFDPRADCVQPLPSELLKIRGKGRGWECVHFSPHDKSCSIYAYRPLECRALYCGDLGSILRAMDEPNLNRADIVPRDSALWACIEDHERNFPVDETLRLAGKGGVITDVICPELDELIRREMHYRRVLAERLQVEDVDLWAYLGRPLWLVLLPLNPIFSRYELI